MQRRKIQAHPISPAILKEKLLIFCSHQSQFSEPLLTSLGDRATGSLMAPSLPCDLACVQSWLCPSKHLTLQK